MRKTCFKFYTLESMSIKKHAQDFFKNTTPPFTEKEVIEKRKNRTKFWKSMNLETFRSCRLECPVKSMFLKFSQNSQENNWARVPLFKNGPWHSGFWKTFKSTLFYRIPPVAASEISKLTWRSEIYICIGVRYCFLHRLCW